MTPERWKRIEELYAAACARPGAERSGFLAQACAGDDSLRRDVESLIADTESIDSFLADPIVTFPEHRNAEPANAAMAGASLGGYRLQGLLGAGGMGEVYRAHDSKLGRDVAIKILPRAFTSDPHRLARLEREAQTLAALNHANVCAIHGFEEADGVRYLILEHVHGQTLAELLADASRVQAEGRGLLLRDALNIARQIADALEAAHEKGIVHRDLKPANVKMTPEGVVKVLDFGLAKAVDRTPAANSHDTLEGVIVGTAAYMSPEQARGKSVDKRTDTWAFGCVLYEMLTGHAPFAGETVSDTLGKILEREPDWSILPAHTPRSVTHLLFRCLTKDPKQRLRDIGEARIAIDSIDDALTNEASTVVVHPRWPTRTSTWLPWLAVAALAAAVGAWAVRRPPEALENPLADAQFTRITDWEGTEGSADISPDGKFVAFLADRDGEFDLWLTQIGSGHFVNLTTDVRSLNPPRSDSLLQSFGFSGDGAEIWFSPLGDPGSQKMIMPMTGGAARAFLGNGMATPSWSPDGTRLVYFTNGDGDPLSIADRMGGDAHRIDVEHADTFFGRGMHTHNPVWSQDGQWIYFVHGVDPTVETDVWRVRASGGSPERLTQQRAALNYPTVLTARTLLYLARPSDQLWALDVTTTKTRRVSSGLERYTSLSASRDGRRIVSTLANPTATLWTVSLLDRMADDRDVQPYPMPTVRALAPRFGGTSLFYLSARGAGDGLWRLHDGQASEIWRGADGALSEPAAVSRDGRRIAVVLRRDGNARLTVMSADGTNARTVAPAIELQGAATQSMFDWSPDGRWIVTGGSDATGQGLMKILVDGDAVTRLASGQANNPIWSPDGTIIVYSGLLVGGQVPMLAMRPDGAPVDIGEARARPGGYRFLPNGTGLIYLPRIQGLDFWLLDFATRTTRQLTRLSDKGVIRNFDITPDGKHIVFDRSRDNSDVVLIDLPAN